jgi:peptidoglycan/LPS O-acetylase OafA/YrhL
MSQRLKSIDFLRGSAALAVVLQHAIIYGTAPAHAPGWFRVIHAVLDQGHLGVPLFFVISGFCIHLRWAKGAAAAGDARLDFGSFWKRRLFRLYPPYVAALCFSMALVAAAYVLHKDVPVLTLYPEPRLRWIAIDFFAHLGMLHGFHPLLDQAGGNPPFWTLAREEYFYLMYFGLLAWRRARGMLFSLAVVFVLGIAFQLVMGLLVPFDHFWTGFVGRFALVLWIQWCLGAAAVEAYYGLIKLPRWCSAGWTVPLWAVAAGLSSRYCGQLEPLLWGMTFFTLLNYCVRLEREGRWPSGPIIDWLVRAGVFSYSLYLIHNPVRAIVKQLLGPLALTQSPVLYLVNAALMAVAGYWAGKLFFWVVERRFLTYRKVADPGVRTPLAAAAPSE